LYDKLPENKNTLLLVELKEPVPFDQAKFTVEEAANDANLSKNVRRIGSLHTNGLNTARQNGTILFTSDIIIANRTSMHTLLGLESNDNAENFNY
ncbi:MAG: hypothetical protein LBC74_12265, partial [Planctomycetaceae bacterium]|jgi:hypothetical protein|nr:hypothetical protein [Planctomycetaceae bacterium]